MKVFPPPDLAITSRLASPSEESKGEKGINWRVGVSKSARGECGVPGQGSSPARGPAALSVTTSISPLFSPPMPGGPQKNTRFGATIPRMPRARFFRAGHQKNAGAEADVFGGPAG